MVVLFLFLAVAARLVALLPPVIDVDEAWFATSGAALERPGDFYAQTADNKPPGTVWFYWAVNRLFGSGLDPRPARALYALVLFASALLIARLARDGPNGARSAGRGTAPPCFSRGAAAAVAFLLASGAPSPEMLSVTTEGLMCLPMLLLMLICWRAVSGEGLSVVGGVVAGAMIAACALLKQTGLFFVAPVLYATWRAARDGKASRAAIAAMVVTSVGSLALAAFRLGPSEVWFWCFDYPRQVLAPARARLFPLQAAALTAAAVAVTFAPMLAATHASLRSIRRTGPREKLLALWIAIACASIVAGGGIFQHYYLLFLAPLAVLYGRASTVRGLAWLSIGATLAATLAAIPSLGALWGTDLLHYEKVGATLARVVPRDEKIFVWGGNALPAVLSGRLPGTRYATARFLVPPYATPATLARFHDDFARRPPGVVVDSHARGDDRISTAPADADPWLARVLARDYVACTSRMVEWTTFYVRRDLGERAAHEGLDCGAAARAFGQSQSDAREAINRLAERILRNPGEALVLEAGFRAHRALEMIEGRREPGRSLASPVSPDKIFAFVRGHAQARGMPVPACAETPFWWLSDALVAYQPRIP
jgi:hypothetical protein